VILSKFSNYKELIESIFLLRDEIYKKVCEKKFQNGFKNCELLKLKLIFLDQNKSLESNVD